MTTNKKTAADKETKAIKSIPVSEYTRTQTAEGWRRSSIRKK